ncbi:MAG TPA: 3'-5' exonuclease [Pseudomonas lactis]|uniref:3'-5' exonuclease n=1 Tax=Pseudomonas lactis TaxID=1615674 RepID=A0A921TA39_9PSED|nr:3'-5' exonuclease [Pseudomonas lactis]HJH21437.1 3'-5' exonuclease [Pseudomonas lactis]
MEKLIAVYDIRATDRYLIKLPSTIARQPHLVDLAILLFTTQGDLVDSFEAIIKPDGWEIPAEVSESSGVTNELAAEQGVPEADAVAAFLAIHDRACLRVAHHIGFDDRGMRIAIKRFRDEETAEQFRNGMIYCTALASKPLCKIPPTPKMIKKGDRSEFKTPTIAEALQILCGEELEHDHRAQPSAEACAKVFFKITLPPTAA